MIRALLQRLGADDLGAEALGDVFVQLEARSGLFVGVVALLAVGIDDVQVDVIRIRLPRQGDAERVPTVEVDLVVAGSRFDLTAAGGILPAPGAIDVAELLADDALRVAVPPRELLPRG